VVSSVAGVTAGAAVSVRVADGRVHATATRTELLDEASRTPQPTPVEPVESTADPEDNDA
jgi:exodeoxyribonuclease VII large subunit